MAVPACTPRPMSSVWMACSTFSPKPRAPIIEATTTMPSDIMTAWLMPARMAGRAWGSSTQNRSWVRVQPKDSADSIIRASTSRMPRAVRRTSGAVA